MRDGIVPSICRGIENLALAVYNKNEALLKSATACFSDFPSAINGNFKEKELSLKLSSMDGVPLRSWLGAYNCHPGLTSALKTIWNSPLPVFSA
jgi:hypothetical protein